MPQFEAAGLFFHGITKTVLESHLSATQLSWIFNKLSSNYAVNIKQNNTVIQKLAALFGRQMSLRVASCIEWRADHPIARLTSKQMLPQAIIHFVAQTSYGTWVWSRTSLCSDDGGITQSTVRRRQPVASSSSHCHTAAASRRVMRRKEFPEIVRCPQCHSQLTLC